MKNYLKTPWKYPVSLFVAIVYLLTVSPAKAQTPPILLTVNITNPDDVVITSTGNDPSQAASGSIGAGFDLVGLLGPGAPTSNDSSLGSFVLSSTLTTGATGTELVFNANTYDDLNGNDVNFYNSGSSTNLGMTFVTNEPAFETGTSLTTNLGALTLLPVGSIGAIETGFDGSLAAYATPNTVIGSYEVVNDDNLSSTPYPSSWTLALIITSVLAALRFRMRRA
jgi:hypothetical protein